MVKRGIGSYGAGDTPIDLDGLYIRETEKAVKVSIEGETIWIPKSQLFHGLGEDWPPALGEGFEFSVPAWFAKKEGLG